MVREIESYQELEEVLQSLPENQLVVLDCYATWCGPCKRFAPHFEELSEAYTDVLFLKSDVEKVEELTTELKVFAMPTFIFFKDVAVIGKIQGINQEKFVAFIEENRV